MMSGLASWLLARRWRIAPDIPKAAPTARPVSPRGRRSVRMMNSCSVEPSPRKRRHDVGQGDREVSDSERPHEHADRRGTQHDGDGNGTHVQPRRHTEPAAADDDHAVAASPAERVGRRRHDGCRS